MNRYLPAALVAATCLITACDPPATHGQSAPATAAAPSTTAGPTPGSASPGATGSVAPISAWWYGGGQGREGWITTDAGNISNDSSSSATLGSDCAALSTDVARARSYGPIPDAQAQHHWLAALGKYQQAATDCTTGAATKNAALIAKAGTEIQAAIREQDAMTARIMRLINGG